MLTVLDLFSGIGGFSLGLERTQGFETKAFCEIDPYCRKVLAKHWPDIPIYGDVRGLTGEQLRQDGIAADVVTGGFPCQDVSVAGKRAGLAGENSGLYRELVRALRVVRPRYGIVENVAALLGDGMGTVLGDLAAGGFDTEWDCIPACAVGAPHIRDRVWIVAHANGLDGRAGAIGENRAEIGNGVGARAAADAADVTGTQMGAAGQPRQREGLGCGTSDPPGDGRGQGRAWRPPDSFARIRDEARRNAADPHGARLAFREGLGRDAWEERQAAQRNSGQNIGQPIWPDEPALSGVDDGISYELDCIRRFRTNKRGSQKSESKNNIIEGRYLRAVWEHQAIAATSPDLYRRRLRDSVPKVPYSDSHGGWHMGARFEKEQDLRDLWGAFYAEPLEKTQNLQSRMLERIRTAERAETMGWTNRIKTTGNTIIPRIPELIGRAILAAGTRDQK